MKKFLDITLPLIIFVGVLLVETAVLVAFTGVTTARVLFVYVLGIALIGLSVTRYIWRKKGKQ